MTSTAFSLLLLVFAPTLPTFAAERPAAGGLQDGNEELLRQRAEELRDAGLPTVWREAANVATLVGDEAGAAFDAALDRLLSSKENFAPRSVLFLVGARLLGEDIDYEPLVERLQPLLDSDDLDASLGAAELLGDEDLRSVESELRESLTAALLAVAEDGDRVPRLRIECAVSAHEVGMSHQVPAARRVLYDFLESADPELRSRGALAFARLGIIEEVSRVETELRRLAGLPSEEGRLAKAYLDRQAERRIAETRLRRERERQRSTGTGKPIGVGEDLLRIERVIDMVKTRHLEGANASREDLVEAAIDGMLRSLDRHSSYFSPRTYKRFEQDLEAEYGGIGAYVASDPQDGLFTITRPIYSGPAYKAGLSTDDKIVRIDDWPTIGEEVDDIIKRLKGRPGTEVSLYVWRAGMDPSFIDRPTDDMIVRLQRDQIVIPPVHSEYLPGDIGLIELTTFSRVASQELMQRMDDMRKQGMRGLVLDLRNNTGGLLDQAWWVADLFLPKGKVVVSTENSQGKSREYKTRVDPLLPEDVPVVVLINRFSASAAEIVAGALQDHGRAKLVGQRSFGKGSVQNLFPMPEEEDDHFADENGNRRFDNWETITKDWNGNGEFDYAPRIKLTIERYLLPTGRSIHRELDDEGNILSLGGVEPDVAVATKRWEQWRLEELLRIERSRAVRDWAQDSFAGNEEVFRRLAAGDLNDTSEYPGFQKLYASLETVLPMEDVRFLARREVKRMVQDVRGEAFPQGDFQEDVQLQEALRLVLQAEGESVENIPAYAKTFDEGDKTRSAPVAGGPRSMREREVDEALTLIAEARGGAGFSEEGLQKLSEILESLKKN